jgi:hypothetical protein
MIALFVVSLAVIPTAGKAPIGAVILVALLCLILRRALRQREELAMSVTGSSGESWGLARRR